MNRVVMTAIIYQYHLILEFVRYFSMIEEEPKLILRKIREDAVKSTREALRKGGTRSAKAYAEEILSDFMMVSKE